MTARRLLLIDDDFSIRLVAQASLEQTGGWQVSTAASGLEGLAMAEAEQPEVILLDVVMPGMDGPATLSRLQGSVRTRDIPVVLLTATLQTSEEAPWAGLPVAGVLAKPFDPLRLSAQVADVLGDEK